VNAMGVRILKTPVRAPKANAFCERLVGTIRRECLDFLIPFGERHLKQVLTLWAAHYNHARVHTSLGPGVPDPIRPSPPMSDPTSLPEATLFSAKLTGDIQTVDLNGTRSRARNVLALGPTGVGKASWLAPSSEGVSRPSSRHQPVSCRAAFGSLHAGWTLRARRRTRLAKLDRSAPRLRTSLSIPFDNATLLTSRLH